MHTNHYGPRDKSNAGPYISTADEKADDFSRNTEDIKPLYTGNP